MTRAAQIFDIAELQELFSYPNRRAITHAIRAGTFPVPTFDMGGRRVASVAVVKKYFQDREREGIEQMERLRNEWDVP